MNYLCGLLFLFAMSVNSCSQATVAPRPANGIYLLLDTAQGNTVAVYNSDSTRGPFYIDTTQQLSSADLFSITVDSLKPEFSLALTDPGYQRFREFSFGHPGGTAALVMHNRMLGVFTLPPYFETSAPTFDLLANRSWMKRTIDSLNKSWQVREDSLPKPPANGKWQEKYASGKIFRKTEFKDSVPLWEKQYYENGNLALEQSDNVTGKGGPFYKEYYPDGKLAWEEYFTRDSTRAYFLDGGLNSEHYYVSVAGKEGTVFRIFDNDGKLQYDEHAEFQQNLPGEKEKMNNPRVLTVKRYRESRLIATGQLYMESPDADADSCGTWKFFDSKGKLKRTTTFPDWKTFYDQSVSNAKKNAEMKIPDGK